jgi:hypothetical protein
LRESSSKNSHRRRASIPLALGGMRHQTGTEVRNRGRSGIAKEAPPILQMKAEGIQQVHYSAPDSSLDISPPRSSLTDVVVIALARSRTVATATIEKCVNRVVATS